MRDSRDAVRCQIVTGRKARPYASLVIGERSFGLTTAGSCGCAASCTVFRPIAGESIRMCGYSRGKGVQSEVSFLAPLRPALKSNALTKLSTCPRSPTYRGCTTAVEIHGQADEH